MPILLLLKADQIGLFDKLVPVAGSVSQAGVVTKPHVAIRHVRAPQAKPVRPAPRHEQTDLFAAPPAKAETKPKKAPESETLDLFAAPKAPERKIAPAIDQEGEPTKGDVGGLVTEAQVRAAAARSVPGAAKVSYDGPFNPDTVPAFGVVAGTSKERRREINAAAAVDAYRQSPNLDLLRQYSGNGGCGDSLNEFYTDPKVAAAMWKVLHDTGLGAGAVVLEPSCATGVFLETAPAGVRVTGVEMDPVSAKIGAVLHPGHEVKNASLERFAQSDGEQFDAVIGNAPFGLRGSLIKDDKKDLSTAEGYFLDTALDKTRSGGLIAMIVPTGILDSRRDRALRERLLRKGEFLGALRMPNTAFEHSHTGVTTDVVFFRKRDQETAGALSAVQQDTLKKLGVWDEEFLSGAYFAERGAPNVLGTMTEGWRAKAGMGDDITVEGSMVGVPAAIAAFSLETPKGATPSVQDVLSACTDDEERARAMAAAMRKPYEAKAGDTKIIEGVEYILTGEPPRWHRLDEIIQTAAVTEAQALAADIERAMNDDGYAAASGLADRVRAYVKQYGNPDHNPYLQVAASRDRQLYRLIGAVKPDGSLSDVVEGRAAVALESSFDAAAAALALEAGQFTPQQLAGRWHGGDAETALDHLYASPGYALDPTSGLWTSLDQYLSGEMWPKYDAATAALAGGEMKPEDRAKLERQVTALEEAIDAKSLEDVECELNSAFIPNEVKAAFFNRDTAQFSGQYAPQRMSISFDRGVYAVNGGPWGSQLLSTYLNRTGVKKDDWPRIEAWNLEFKEWLCASPYRDQVEEAYNRSFRGFRQRAYSDAAFQIPGLNDDGLKAYQWSGLRWALEAGKGIIAADVGLGKTARGLMLVRMLKVTGRAKRPMIVVPKSVLANWLAEAEKWFPGSSVLTIGETYSRDKNGKLTGKPDTAAERNRKFHDLTQNDYDFILISQPAWNDLDLDPITKGEYIDSDFWVQRGDSLGNAGDKRTNKIREAYNQAVAKRDFAKRSDAMYFNDLGVDAIIGDEMHAYKNLFAARNRFGQSPKFLGGSGLSNRALDMQMKSRWVREHNGGANVFGLTATPTKNSPLEIYSMLSHIAPEAFVRIGVRNSEEFLDRFCEFETRNILNTKGEIEEALCTVGFKNLGELREIMGRYIDRKTAEDVGLQLPARDERQHLIDMTEEQKAVYAELRILAEEAKGKDATGEAHIFSIMDKMGKAAMDLELYDPTTYAGAKSPKYDAAVANIIEGAKDGGQIVFAENLAVHDKMLEALVAAGMPRDQIAIFNAQVAASSAQRQNITDAFNAGKLKTVIGNATMSEGVNLQKGTTDIHHMDLPWEPATMQQRNGRGLRQGNINEAVRLHSYIAKGSFDGYRFQTVSAKKDWQDLLWNGGDRVDNLALEGALSRDDMMIMLSEDPDAAREKLATNKAAAEVRFKALKHTEAAASFAKYQEMKRSLSSLRQVEREKPSGQRLKVRLDRLRVGLDADPYFTAKHALDSEKPVLIHPQTGVALQPGVAFEMAAKDGSMQGGGKFVVTKVMPQVSTVQVRRYGVPNGQHATFGMQDLEHGITPFDYDEKAEHAEIQEAMATAAKDKLSTLTGLKDLHGLPPAAVKAAYAGIQQQAKAGMREYRFDTGYGPVGLVSPEGEAIAAESYDAKGLLDTHDLMVPTDEHRALAENAWLADERGKQIVKEFSTGRRGARTGETHLAVKYAGKYGHSGGANRWGGIGDSAFGPGFEADMRGRYEREQVEKARHAPSLGEAISDVAHAAVGAYGRKNWPRRGLAVIWAKAKRAGALDSPWDKTKPAGLPNEVFNTGYGASAGSVPHNATVGGALAHLAKESRHSDLAAAMLVGGGGMPGTVVGSLLELPPSPSTGAALRHLIAKDPGLAKRRAVEFVPGGRLRAYDIHGADHALYRRFGERAKTMTLGELADDLSEGADDDGGELDAA